MEVNHEAAALKRRLEVLEEARPVQLSLMHLSVIDPDRLLVSALYAVGSRLRVVKAALNFKGLVHLGIHAHAEPDAVFVHVLVDKPF